MSTHPSERKRTLKRETIAFSRTCVNEGSLVMSQNLFKNVRNVILAIALGAWAAGWGPRAVYAQHNMMHMNHQGMDHSAPKAATPKPAVPAPPGPHGGQMTTTASAAIEVVYQPQEIRVYLYGPVSRRPQSARVVEGEVGLRRGNSSRTFTATLQYVAPPPGSSEQDYLAVAAKLGDVNEGEMRATFTLKNLPMEPSTATFGQSVAISKPKPQVTLAALEQSDQAGIARQKVCPVTGAALGSMGGPVKVLVGGQPVYLCCKGCVGKVQSAPESYLPKAAQASQGE
jgi:hypothetical protein